MLIEKKTMRASPFVGVFCVATDKVVLVPMALRAKEKKGLEEVFDAEVVPVQLAGSGLLGVLCVGNSNGFCVSNIAEDSEVQELQDVGIPVTKLPGVEALGNLVVANDSTGLCSSALGKKARQNIESTLKILLHPATIAGSDIVGSAMVLTNRGFLVHPNVRGEEFAQAQTLTKKEGKATTANQGDLFVGNSVVANSQGAIVGTLTTGHELLRIDEGLNS